MFQNISSNFTQPYPNPVHVDNSQQSNVVNPISLNQPVAESSNPIAPLSRKRERLEEEIAHIQAELLPANSSNQGIREQLPNKILKKQTAQTLALDSEARERLSFHNIQDFGNPVKACEEGEVFKAATSCKIIVNNPSLSEFISQEDFNTTQAQDYEELGLTDVNYNDLIKNYCDQDEVEKAEAELAKLEAEGDEPDLEVLISLMTMYMHRQNTDPISQLLRKYNNFEFSIEILQKVMLFFVEQKDIVNAQYLLDMMLCDAINGWLDLSSVPFDEVIKLYQEKPGNEKAIQLILWNIGIYKAIEENDFSTFKDLVKANPSFVNATSEVRGPLIFELKEFRFIEYVLDHSPVDLSLVSKSCANNTILHFLIANADNESAMLYLTRWRNKLNPNIINDQSSRFKTTTLHLAVAKGYQNEDADGNPLSISNFQLVDQLLLLGANIHAATKEGNTALHLACLQRDSLMIARLLTAGADIKAVNDQGLTPLDYLHLSLSQAQEILEETVKVFRKQNANTYRYNYESAALTICKFVISKLLREIAAGKSSSPIQ